MKYSKLDKAKAQLAMDHPFYAAIILQKPLIPTTSIPTMCITAKGKIYYNPEFIETLTVPNIVFGLAHEGSHYMGRHFVRKQHRDLKRWNIAGDAWINDTLIAANVGTPIPDGVYIAGAKDRTVEDIYEDVPEGNGEGPGGLGIDLSDEDDPQTDSDKQQLEAQIKREVNQAAQSARMRGMLSAALEEFVAKCVESRVPWYELTEYLMDQKCNEDYTWLNPNKRHMPEFYLPSLRSENRIGEVVLQIDVSGSIQLREFDHYVGHMVRIVEACRPERIHVLYTDTQVVHHDTYENGEVPTFKYRTGGGTDMRAGYDYIDKAGIEPAVVITLTDGYTPFPENVSYPSIWCISTEGISAPEGAGDSVHFTVEPD